MRTHRRSDLLISNKLYEGDLIKSISPKSLFWVTPFYFVENRKLIKIFISNNDDNGSNTNSQNDNQSSNVQNNNINTQQNVQNAKSQQEIRSIVAQAISTPEQNINFVKI